MAQDDFTVVTKLILQTASRNITGDSNYLQSDLLELQNKIRKHRRDNLEFSNEDSSVLGIAARNYKKFLKQCGLIDKWDLIKTLKDTLEENAEKPIVLIHSYDSKDEDIIDQLAPSVTPIVINNGSLVKQDKCSVSELKIADSAMIRDVVSDQIVIISSFLR